MLCCDTVVLLQRCVVTVLFCDTCVLQMGDILYNCTQKASFTLPYRGSDKSLARRGRKEATATKL
jgi:hypothetical protein